MIKHMVFWKLKETALERSAGENAAIMKANLEALVGQIQEIVSLEIGTAPENPRFDLCLISRFANQETLNAYIKHPLHQECIAFSRQVVEDRLIFDFQEE